MNHELGQFDSWEIVSETKAIKSCDKSFFRYSGSGVPKQICWFFGADDLAIGEKRPLVFLHSNKEFSGYVINDTTDRRRIRIFWNKDLAKYFSVYEFVTGSRAEFIKVSENKYQVVLVLDSENKRVMEEINEERSDTDNDLLPNSDLVPSYTGFVGWIKNNSFYGTKKIKLLRKIEALQVYYNLHKSGASDVNLFEMKSSEQVATLLKELKETPLYRINNFSLHGKLLPIAEYYLRYVLECEATSIPEQKSLETQKQETKSFIHTEFPPEVVSASDEKPKRHLDSVTDPIALEQNNRMESLLEGFTQWMRAKGSLENGVINGYCSSIRLAEFYLQEQKPQRWSIFPTDLKEAKRAISALNMDEEFRRRDTRFSGKYFTALAFFQNYIDDQLSKPKEITQSEITTTVDELPESKVSDHLPEPVIQETSKETPETSTIEERQKASGENTFVIKTKHDSYTGASVAEAFAAFCDHLVICYPLTMRSLSGAPFNGQGSVVLKKTSSKDDVRLRTLNAYISGSLSDIAAMNYGKWLCKMCNDTDPPQLITQNRDDSGSITGISKMQNSEIVYEVIKPLPPTSKNDITYSVTSGADDSAFGSGDAKKQEPIVYDPSDGLVSSLVLDADLDGITALELSQEISNSVSQVWRIVEADNKIVVLDDRLYHIEAFVDWEEAADQLIEILEKLMTRNDGYVSNTQLYDYARLDLQMFLNDNDLDDSRKVFDFAQYLFSKLCYKGIKYSFSGKNHISRAEESISSMMDLILSYARSHDGYFAEDELADHLKKLGLKTGNLRGIMQVYTKPIFLLYEDNVFVSSESLNIDASWFSTISIALDKLFADMGDHIVLRDIHPAWLQLLPELPAARPWTLVLLQSVLRFYSKKLNGARTISALSNQSMETIQAMLVSGDCDFRTFADVVASFLVDDEIVGRRFTAEELRLLLVQRGIIQGNELLYTMPKALSDDMRFAWDATGEYVSVNI